MRLARSLLAAAAITAIASTLHATTVERVVAVVGEHAILLSDLRTRGRPRVAEIEAQVPPGPQRTTIEGNMYRQLLQQMVDERLEQMAAERAKITVTAEEIDRAVGIVAAQNKLTVDELFAAKLKLGETIQEYRDELRRQIITEKLIALRVSPRVRISSEDVRTGYEQLQREERQQLPFKIQWVVLQVPANSSDEAKAERKKLAEKIVADARAGIDFATLAKTYSDDSASRPKGGDLGSFKPGELAPVLEEAAFAMDVGEVSKPLQFGNDLVVIKVYDRDPSQLPPLASAQNEVASKVYGDRLLKARRQWLDELQRGIYVEKRY